MNYGDYLVKAYFYIGQVVGENVGCIATWLNHAIEQSVLDTYAGK